MLWIKKRQETEAKHSVRFALLQASRTGQNTNILITACAVVQTVVRKANSQSNGK